MKKSDVYSLTHDTEGNPLSWIVGTEKDNGTKKKPDLTVWARGYNLESLQRFADYLKSSSTNYSAFILIDAVTGRIANLEKYMQRIESR